MHGCQPVPSHSAALVLASPAVSSYPSFKIQDAEEKAKARQELVAGALGDKLKLLSKLVVSEAVRHAASKLDGCAACAALL